MKREKHIPRTAEFSERFWRKTQRVGGCLEWTGSKNAKGYGRVWVGSIDRMMKAHRAAWEIRNGPIAEGMHVLHACDNPRCVEPSHLSLGSRSDNMKDMHTKGRCPQTKLTEAAVRDIRSGGNAAALAARYGVSDALISKVRRRLVWAHVE